MYQAVFAIQPVAFLPIPGITAGKARLVAGAARS
jgi:hypothetical protein